MFSPSHSAREKRVKDLRSGPMNLGLVHGTVASLPSSMAEITT